MGSQRKSAVIVPDVELISSLYHWSLRTTRVPVGSYNVQEGWGVVLTPSLSRGTSMHLLAAPSVVNVPRVLIDQRCAVFPLQVWAWSLV